MSCFSKLEECTIAFFEAVQAFDSEHGHNSYDPATLVNYRIKSKIIFECIRAKTLTGSLPNRGLEKCYFIELDKPVRPVNLQPLIFLESQIIVTTMCQIPQQIVAGIASPFQLNVIPIECSYFNTLMSLRNVFNLFSHFNDGQVTDVVKRLYCTIVSLVEDTLKKAGKPGVVGLFPEKEQKEINKLQNRSTEIRRKEHLTAKPIFNQKEVSIIPFENIFSDKYKTKIDAFLDIIKDSTPAVISNDNVLVGPVGAMTLFFSKLNERGVIKIKKNKELYGVCIAAKFPGLRKSFIDQSEGKNASATYGKYFDKNINNLIVN